MHHMANMAILDDENDVENGAAVKTARFKVKKTLKIKKKRK